MSTAEQKILRAKALLIAATQQRRREYDLARKADRCGCGHRREHHTITCSVNYTQGMCMASGCKCLWFLMSPEQKQEALIDGPL